MKTIKKSMLWIAFIAIPVLFSCKKNDTPAMPEKPTIATAVITGITANSATGGGVIGDSSNRYTIIARGIRYSNSGDPAGSFPSVQTQDMYNTSGIWGSYPSNMVSLTPNTTYYVRAYVGYKDATNTQYFLNGDLRTFKTLP